MPRIRSGSIAVVGDRPAELAATPSRARAQLIRSRGGACVACRRARLPSADLGSVPAEWTSRRSGGARERELEEYARLALRVGVNLEEGQDVTVHVLRRARAARPRDRAASPTPRGRAGSTRTTSTSTCAARGRSSRPTRRSAGRRRGCSSGSRRRPSAGPRSSNIVGEPDPDLFAGLDAERVAESVMPELRRALLDGLRPRRDAVDDRRVPDARLGGAGLRRARRRAPLGRDPRDRPPRRGRPGRRLDASTSPCSRQRAAQLNERGFDAVRFRGPGTDLTVGLLAAVALDGGRRRRRPGAASTSPNLPTEEVFTTPGPAADRGPRALDAAARARRRNGRPRPGDDVLRRADHRGDGVLRRGRGARRGRPWTTARPTSARSRSSTRRSRVGRSGHDLLEHALRRERRVAHRLRDGRHAARSTSTGARRTTRSSRRWASTARAPTRTS